MSYTKMGAHRQYGPSGTAVQLGSTTLPADELAKQLQSQIVQTARDVEKTFITGTYAKPTTNAQPRKTRGLLQAITTNVATTTHKASELTADDVLDLLQKVKDGFNQEERNLGGGNLKKLETDFGSFNVMLNRYMPATKLAVVSLEQLAPAFLEVPGKGHFFAEPLSKTGASERVMLYGEIGLKYGNEKAHGVLTVAAG